MTDMLLRHVALVSESAQIRARDLTRVSAALQKQATRDLVQFWNVKATVDAFARLEDVPVDYWPIMVMDDIGEPGAAGIHMDKNGQPFALVTASAERDEWSLTTSHELIEMLVDPFGNRLVAGDSPKADQGRAQILVEACDPSEAAEFAYTVNGVLVSDFYSVQFFDPVAAPGVRYSFTGAIQEPRQVLRGGYLSWLDVASDTWWQEIWFEGDNPTFRNLGKLDAGNGSFRSQIDRLTSEPTRRAQAGGLRMARAAGLAGKSIDEATEARASSLRRQIEELTAGSGGRRLPSKRAEGAEMQAHDQEEWVRSPRRAAQSRGNGPNASSLGLRMAPSVRATAVSSTH